MKLKKLSMELGYRYARMLYENGPPEHLMELVETGDAQATIKIERREM